MNLLPSKDFWLRRISNDAFCFGVENLLLNAKIIHEAGCVGGRKPLLPTLFCRFT
jgi:hypothetical protein